MTATAYTAPVAPAPVDDISPAPAPREPFYLELADVRELVKALERVAKAVDRKSYVQILECVRLEVTGEHGSRLELTTTDLDMAIRETIDIGASTSTGIVLVGCRSLIAACKTLSGPAEFELVGVDRETFEVRQGSSAIRLPAGELEDYPVLPAFCGSDGFALSVDRVAFLRAFESISRTYSRDESRPVLTGVHIALVGDSRLVLAATDSYRLAVDGVDVLATNTAGPWPGCTIRGGELAKVCALAKKDKKGPALTFELELECPEVVRQLVVHDGNRVVTMRAINGQFPDWRRLIPDDMPVRVTFDSAAAIAALERIASLTEKNQPARVSFTHDNQAMRFEAATSADISLSETIAGVVAGEGFEAPIGFNPGYMIDAIRSIGEERVTLWSISPLRPGLFTSSEVQVLRVDQIDDSRLVLLMPVRLAG